MERFLTALMHLAVPPGASRGAGQRRRPGRFAVAAIPILAVGGLGVDVARADPAGSTAGEPGYVEVAANPSAVPGVRGLEVVLVLDVTGSMYHSFTAGERRIEAMRDAALRLVNIMFADNPEPDLLKVSIVPYNTTVNIGTDMHDFVADTGVDANGNPTSPNPFNETSWFGCVQARNNGNDLTDVYDPLAADGTGKWPAYRWPIEPDRRLSGTSGSTRTFNYCETRADNITGDYYRYEDPLTDFERVESDTWQDFHIPQLWVAGQRSYDLDTDGPNKGCPAPLLPLTNSHEDVWNYLQENVTVVGGNGTITATGMTWGWRVLSPQPPFEEGRPYDDVDWEKAIIVLTDGNQLISSQHRNCDNASYVTNPIADRPPGFRPWVFDPASRNMDGIAIDEGPDYRWSAYGYVHPLDSAPLGTGYINSILQNHLVETCDAIKAVEDPIEGGSAIRIFAITFGNAIYPGDSMSETMRYCASDPVNNYFHAPDAFLLEEAFEEIFRQLTVPSPTE